MKDEGKANWSNDPTPFQVLDPYVPSGYGTGTVLNNLDKICQVYLSKIRNLSFKIP